MKKSIAILFVLLLISGAAYARMTVIGIAGMVASESSSCPSWGTYGTSDGNLTFAWDGGHPSGNTYACDETESAVNASAYDLTFGGTGSSTYAIIDALGDDIYWAIDSAQLSTVAGDGWTACLSVQFEADTGGTNFFEVSSTGTQSMYAQIPASSEYVYFEIYDDDAESGYSHTGSMPSTSTPYNVCFSWQQGRATADFAVSDNGGTTWSTSNTGFSAFTDTINAIRIGIGGWSTYNVEVRVHSLAVIKGWQQSVPW